jgi:hypothetical protein
MKPVSSSLWISAFAAFTFSSYIFWSFCFMGFTLGFTCNLCSITSLLTPTRSEVDHANMSLFLSRNTNNSACSSWLSPCRCTQLYRGLLGSKGTFLNSSSTSMAFLYSVGASALLGHADSWWCSDSSHRKCTIL